MTDIPAAPPATPPQAPPASPPAAPETPPPAWHQSEAMQPYGEWLGAKGLASIDDPLEAMASMIKIGQGAEKFLGKPADTLMTRPREGESLAAWRRENAGVFGLPDAADQYEITRPDLPQGMEWDGTLEQSARDLAFQHGLDGDAVNALVGMYAEHMKGTFDSVETELQAANMAMMEDLQKDWGRETNARIDGARMAAAQIMEKAGLDEDGRQAVFEALKPAIGDAGMMRMFAAIGEMMGEDNLSAGTAIPIGGKTPQQADAELRALDAPTGEYGAAFRRGDRETMKALSAKRNELIRIASGG